MMESMLFIQAKQLSTKDKISLVFNLFNNRKKKLKKI